MIDRQGARSDPPRRAPATRRGGLLGPVGGGWFWVGHLHSQQLSEAFTLRSLPTNVCAPASGVDLDIMASFRRVLSIQSHVVHGCVGNRAAALPLQLLGIETDVLNTVQYSNHVGYGSFAGEKLTGEQVFELLNGMHANGLLGQSHVLTGYMGSAEAIRAVLRALPLLRSARSDMQFWCDPVLGDNGRLYVPPALVDVYRDEVVPHAHALLPNQFEAEVLTGITIRTTADARRACGALHRRGVDLVVITSAQLEDAPTAAASGPARADDALPPLSVLLSRRPSGTQWRRQYRLDVPQLPQRFAGTGDLLAGLLLGWSCHDGVRAHVALRRALTGVQSSSWWLIHVI